jgi:hypothetical protein
MTKKSTSGSKKQPQTGKDILDEQIAYKLA